MAANEELAALIRAGDRERLGELWTQVRGLVRRKARRWAAAGLGGVEPEDLTQAGFIAVMQAADSFDPAAGCAFTTWLEVYLKQEFAAATGQRTKRDRLDPLQTAVSLDMPLTDSEGSPFILEDTLPDPAAEAALAAVGERDFAQRRRAAVEYAIATLPEDQQAAIRGRYFKGEKVSARVHEKALRLLRHPSRARALMAYW